MSVAAPPSVGAIETAAVVDALAPDESRPGNERLGRRRAANIDADA
jgi:hypothetical protein